MPQIRKSNGELIEVPCNQCIAEGAATVAGENGRPWLEVCPLCGHYISPGKGCLVCQLGTIGRLLSGSAGGHYISVYERKES